MHYAKRRPRSALAGAFAACFICATAAWGAALQTVAEDEGGKSGERMAERCSSPEISMKAPSGEWTATVDALGNLLLEGKEEFHAVAENVLPELSFSLNGRWLVYPQRRQDAETDLMLLALPPDLPARVLVALPGSEDRPSFSPDSRTVAFVGTSKGLASVFTVKAGEEKAKPKQRTNLSVNRSTRQAGQAPAGFTPPPDRRGFRWEKGALTWQSGEESNSVRVDQ